MTKSGKTKKTNKEEQGVIVETFQKATDAVSTKIKDYNEKYLSKAIENGKEKVKEINEKYLEKTIEKGKDTFKEYNEKYLAKNIEKGKEYFEKPYNNLTDKVDEVLAKGRDIEKDTLKKLDEFVENGRKFMYKIPMVETVENKMTDGLKALPGIINMPSKGEIEKLTKAMKALNSNIELLKTQKAI